MNMLAIQSMAASGVSLSPKRPAEAGKFGDLLSNQLATSPSNANGEEQVDGTKNLLQQLLDILNPPSEGQEALLPLTTADEHSISETEILEDLKDEGLDASSMAGMIAALTNLIDRLSLNDMKKIPAELIKMSGFTDISGKEVSSAINDIKTNLEAGNVKETVSMQSANTTNINARKTSDATNMAINLTTLLNKMTEQNDLEKMIQQLSKDVSIKNQGNILSVDTLTTVLKTAKTIAKQTDNTGLLDDQKKVFSELKEALSNLGERLTSIMNRDFSGKSYLSKLQAGFNSTRFIVSQKVGSIKMDLPITKTDATTENHAMVSHSFIAPSKVEQYVWNIGSNKQVGNAEQFAKAFENILSQANFTSKNGTQKLMIRLNPENLGSLKVELIQKDGIMMAKIMTSTNAAKEIMDSQMHSLKQGLANQNIHVEKIEISQGLNNLPQERNLGREQGQQQQPNQQQHQKQTEENEEFLSQFAQALDQSEVEV